MNATKSIVLNKLIEYGILALIISGICILSVCFFNDREEFLFDEILTFQRSASINRDNSKEIDYEHPMGYINSILDSNSFTHLISLEPQNSVLNLPLLDVIEKFTFENGYNTLLNILSSILGHSLDFHDSLVLNLVIYSITLLIVYQICQCIFNRQLVSFACIILIGASYCTILITNYVRFYSFYTLMMVVLAYIYVKRIQRDYIWWKEVLLTILSLLITYIGYRPAEYALVLSATLLVGYAVVCFIKKRRFSLISTIGIYLIFGTWFLYQYRDVIKENMQNGLVSTTDMSQLKVAILNLMNRSVSEQWEYFVSFWGVVVDYTLLIPGLIIIVVGTAAYFVRYRKIDVSWDKLSVLMLLIASFLYILILSRICPWNTWRFISPIYIFFVIIISSCLAMISKKRWWAIALVVMIVLTNRFFYFRNRELRLHNLMENDGPSFAQREYFREEYDGYDSIYFYSGDAGTLYYGAFLWPDNAEVYFTTKEEMGKEEVVLSRILANDRLLVWVDRNDSQINDSIPELMKKYGFEKTELEYDTTSAGRHYVYLSKKRG